MGEHEGSAGSATRAVALPDPATGVHIWTCELARSIADVAAMKETLSEAELARAARFGRAELRDRYVVGRATLRAILGDALGVPPSRVGIVRGRRGRPAIDGGGIDFNVSHTEGTALFGLTRDARIGVDIEHRGRDVNVDGIARKFMTEGEQAMLQTLGEDARRQALLRLWTCKEAMSKATGDALSAPFRRLGVVLGTGAVLVEGPAPYDPGRWQLFPVEVPGSYLATVALWHDPHRS